MLNTEFSNQFDVLYNNITSNLAPGLNEYEKSVFLTKALNEIVKNYFLPEANAKQKGFDDTAKRLIDFSMLMDNADITAVNELLNPVSKFDHRSKVYKIPDEVFIIINESIELRGNAATDVKGIRQVIPISFDEYRRLMSKPYKEPLKYQAWRLLTKQIDNNKQAEVIIKTSDLNIKVAEEPMVIYVQPVYCVRYIKKPRPIILENFYGVYGEEVTIEGKNGSEAEYSDSGSNTTWEPCELDSMLHEEILQRAVELAKIAWGGDLNDIQAVIQAGQRSE